MEQLLHEGESSSLDYKRDQYPFVGASNEDKSELLKDKARIGRVDEYLERHFGEEYRRYKVQVNEVVPFPRLR